MVLGFKTEINGKHTFFVQKILSSFGGGIFKPKLHTIRKGNRWKAGKTIHFATGQRTKNYQCFHVAKCVSVQSIEIIDCDNIPPSQYNNQVHVVSREFGGVYFYNAFMIKVDGRALTVDEIITLAHNDGFDSTKGFYEWFEFKEFSGQLIHWTDLRY